LLALRKDEKASSDIDPAPCIPAMTQPVEVRASELVGVSPVKVDPTSTLEVLAIPEYTCLSAKTTRTLTCMVTTKTCTTPPEPMKYAGIERAGYGIDIVIVFDTSASMLGDKIGLLTATLFFIVDHLAPIDRLCLVSFNDEARMLTSLWPVNYTNKVKIRSIISDIRAGGGTCISKGLKLGK
jgi:von Willebrand factor type A domain